MPFEANVRTARTGLRDQLGEASEDTDHKVYFMGGQRTVREQRDGRCHPFVHQDVFARELCELLNREVWRDGQWLVVWAKPGWNSKPRKLTMAWKDQDGDVPFVVEDEHDPIVIQAWGKDRLVEMAENAYQAWQAHEKDVGITPDQKIKAAQGEPSRDSRAASPLFKT